MNSEYHLLWSEQSVMELRRDHRIVGQLSGTLIKFPQQSRLLGLPLLLSKTEFEYARTKTDTVDASSIFSQIFTRIFDGDISDETKKYFSLAPNSTIGYQQWREFLIKNPGPDRGYLSKVWTLEHHLRSHLAPRAAHSINLITVTQSDNCLFKTKPDVDILSFHKLIENTNSYLTSGHRYGGRFCLYGGDPILFHSAAVVYVIKESQNLTYRDIVRPSRLSSNTGKHAIIGQQRREDNEKVSVFTLRWTGW